MRLSIIFLFLFLPALATWGQDLSFTENNQIAVLKDFTGTTTTLNLEKIEIEHRNKFIIRYRQKLYDSTPERIKGSGRVTISSGNSGNTTTTTVQST